MAAATASLPAPAGTENLPPDQSITQNTWRENLNTHMICQDCKEVPPNLVEEGSEIVCATCGLVLADRLVSYETEWRTFNSDEGKGDDPNRVGEAANPLLNDGQLATQIGGYGGNANKQTRALQRVQNLQSGDKANKNLTAAYKLVDQWIDQADLTSNVRNATKLFYKRVDDAKAFKGKSTEGLVAGCIFIACRQCKTPRTFSEIFGLTNVPKKEIGRIYKQLEKFLTNSHDESIKIIESQGGIVDKESAGFKGTQSTKPADLCGRFCGQLSLGFKTDFVARRLAEKIPTIENLAGRSPLSSAAACIYFASHLLGKQEQWPANPTTTKAISNAISVSDATIKHAYKLLLAEKDRLIEKEWLLKNAEYASVSNLPNT